MLTSGPVPPNPGELLASNHMAALLRDLRHRYDVVLIDSPPLLPVSDAAAVVPATDGAILICRYGRHPPPGGHGCRGPAVSLRATATMRQPIMLRIVSLVQAPC